MIAGESRTETDRFTLQGWVKFRRRWWVIFQCCFTLQACKHPLAIEGEGDIVDLNGSGYGCTLEQYEDEHAACLGNEVVNDDYFVNYSPVPRPGWRFVRWDGPCGHLSEGSNCRFESPEIFVQWFDENQVDTSQFKITAVFERLSTPTQLNDTGVTYGLTEEGNDNVFCTGIEIEEQDCNHGRDATHNDDSDGLAGFSYTKLNNSGETLPVSSPSWSCVRDNVTGLVWEVKTNDGGVHGSTNTYYWGGISADKSLEVGFDDWDELVLSSRRDRYCGFDDWRVPTQLELQGLINWSFRTSRASIDTRFFPHTQFGPYACSYWTSELTSVNFTSGTHAGFYACETGCSRRAQKASCVRLVRGG